MNRLIGILLMVAGVILLAYGLRENDSFGSAFSRAFTGSPTDKAMWLMGGGGLLAAVGAAVVFLPRKKKS